MQPGQLAGERQRSLKARGESRGTQRKQREEGKGTEINERTKSQQNQESKSWFSEDVNVSVQSDWSGNEKEDPAPRGVMTRCRTAVLPRPWSHKGHFMITQLKLTSSRRQNNGRKRKPE